MIGYLKGKIISLDPLSRSLIILAQNVGYKVSVTTEGVAQAKLNQEVDQFIHTAVREDNIALYGFAKKEELAFFEQLMSVSGIGPKSALGILNMAEVSSIKRSISQGDTAALTKVFGIGKKSAERIVVEPLAFLPIQGFRQAKSL